MNNFFYPSPTLEGSTEVKTLRIARHCQCSRSSCDCKGLHPRPGQQVEIVLEIEDAEFSEAGTACECGHSWKSHGALNTLVDAEIERRAKVALRADEFLEEAEKLEDFTFTDPEIDSLLKQMDLPPGEERDASFKRGHSPESVASATRSKRSRSLSSSRSSDIPKGVKRRRITSPLSDEDDDAEDMDEDHSMAEAQEPSAGNLKTPATPVVSKGLKAPPVPVLSGARPNARAGKKRAPGASGAAPAVNPPVNGMLTSHAPKIKQEDDIDDGGSVSETVTTATAPEETAGMSIDLPPKEKAVVEEHARGYIMFAPVHNDGTERSYIILTGLKNLFQRQLPKMPREYISRLVMDPNSRALAIVKHGYKVVAGITYRPFPHRGFIEIVFCAVSSSNQVKGYGGHLMDHFKKHIQEVYAEQKVETFLTYADNYAVGYFKKQGFSKDVTLDRAQWAGYIKDYEGATLLQCTLVPVDYTTIRETLMKQKEWIMERIRQQSSSHIVHEGIPAFQDGQPPTMLDYKDIPGLLEAGWTAHPATQEIPANIKAPDYVRMTRALRALQAHQQSWPFRAPVNKVEVPDYYEFIKNPMDLHTMQTKLENGEYTQVSRFIQDVRVIGENCLAYNPHDSVYAKAASKLMRYFELVLLKELEEKE